MYFFFFNNFLIFFIYCGAFCGGKLLYLFESNLPSFLYIFCNGGFSLLGASLGGILALLFYAFRYKIELSVIKPNRVKAIEDLKNEIAFLENLKDSEPFWRAQMSDKYLSRHDRIAKTHSQLSDDDQRKFIESFF